MSNQPLPTFLRLHPNIVFPKCVVFAVPIAHFLKPGFQCCLVCLNITCYLYLTYHIQHLVIKDQDKPILGWHTEEKLEGPLAQENLGICLHCLLMLLLHLQLFIFLIFLCFPPHPSVPVSLLLLYHLLIPSPPPPLQVVGPLNSFVERHLKMTPTSLPLALLFSP